MNSSNLTLNITCSCLKALRIINEKWPVKGPIRNISVWESFSFCCFSFVASESSFFVGQTFWSSLSFFVV
ncbi:unnamed protein product [Rhizophagus irregularis]|nr:unnamed protein product [Rhizophagus irregularis]